MDWPQVHLALNHLPVIGTIAAGLLLAAARIRRSDELSGAAFAAMVLVAASAAAAFLTGEPAEEALEALGPLPEALVHAHEESAEIALWAAVAWGVLGAVGLARLRGKKLLPGFFWMLASVGFLVLVAFMARTAHLGGRIRHPELRPAVEILRPPTPD